MFFKKKKIFSAVELGNQLTYFVKLNTKKGGERIGTEKTKNISYEKLCLEYFIFNVFIVDYAVAFRIQDNGIKNSVLDSFYLKIKTQFASESFELINQKLDIYEKIIRENKDWSEVIQKLGFAFSRKLLNEVDLILALKIGEEFVLLLNAVSELIKESKLINGKK